MYFKDRHYLNLLILSIYIGDLLELLNADII